MRKRSRIYYAALVPILVVANALASIAGDTELAAKLTEGTRSETDKARDAGRKPAQVVTFLGVQPGSTVVDLIAAGGYYTEVLSVAVGPEGKVYAQNNQFVLQIRDGANDKAMKQRLDAGRLSNVERLDREMSDLGLEAGSIDAAITALNFHDIYNSRGIEAAQAFLATVYRLLKPGGVLGVIDHQGIASEDNKALHRIEKLRVLELIEASPFVVEAESELLGNSADDHTKGVFDPFVRGKTDRFLLRLRKPSTG